MKRLKSLVKMELPVAFIMTIYFVVINIIGLAITQNNISNIWEYYLKRGIKTAHMDEIATGFPNMLNGTMIFVSVMYGIGLCLLVYLSFLKDKNHETSRFLKVLPYTIKERVQVKVGIGLMSYFIGILTLIPVMFLLRARFIDLFEEIYNVTNLHLISKQLLSGSYVGKRILILAVLGFAIYLFLVMMQYLMSHNIASILSGCFIGLSPVFIYYSLTAWRIYSPMVEEFLGVIYMGPIERVQIALERTEYGINYLSYNSIGDIKNYLLFWIAISMLCYGGIIQFSESYALEKSDCLITHSIFRWIYIIGVTVCGALLIEDIYILATAYRDGASLLVLIVGLIISFIIAYKISYIGMNKSRKHKGVKA